MYKDSKVIVVMPAYNAALTLEKTHEEVMAQGVVDLVIVVDDASLDETSRIAARLPDTIVYKHDANRGYGGNQKSCYAMAVEEGADIVVMVHPDYQYTPRVLPSMVSMIGNEVYSCVIASRILGGHALSGGMPRWRYVANRLLTMVENPLLGAKVSEFHTGYRAFSRELLLKLPLGENSDDFIFDNQMLAQILWAGYSIGEVSCPTRYASDASSINFRRSVVYGWGCLLTGLEYRLARMRLINPSRLPAAIRR